MEKPTTTKNGVVEYSINLNDLRVTVIRDDTLRDNVVIDKNVRIFFGDEFGVDSLINSVEQWEEIKKETDRLIQKAFEYEDKKTTTPNA